MKMQKPISPLHLLRKHKVQLLETIASFSWAIANEKDGFYAKRKSELDASIREYDAAIALLEKGA